VAIQELTFPLLPRRRLVGLAFGAMHSARRGTGSDVAGSRPYRPGDDVDTIDWAASAKLSSARGSDEFVVREQYAEEAPRVVVFCDRRPEMTLCAPELPWLRKDEAMRSAAILVAESATRARGFIGYLDYALGDDPFWRPPKSTTEGWHIAERHLAFPDFDAPQDTVALALDFLAQHRRSVPAGTFVFLLSDFLVPPPPEAWARALELRWDLVPVVIQDPVWEQTFPDVDEVVLPLAGPDGRVRAVRLGRGESRRCREANERRRDALLTSLVTLGIDPVLVSSAEREQIFRAFLAWSDERQFRRGRGW
jgi:uncharacterized protein (DUF58 family)